MQQIPKRRRIGNIVVLPEAIIHNKILPEAIIHNEILTRLPIKYILRYRLVCKSWKSLLSDPSFLQTCQQYSCCDTKEDLFIAMKPELIDHGIRILSRTQEFHVPIVPKLSTIFLGSINGLVCLSCEDGKEQFSLWNPAITQVKNIDLPSGHRHRYCTHSVGGFSWDPVQNDYKLVVVCYDCKIPRCFLVYSSNSATWTPVPVLSTHSVLPLASVFKLQTSLGPKGITPPSTLVKGIPYWTYSHDLPGCLRRRKVITTFKFVAEYNEFRLLPDLDTNTMKIRGKRFNIVNIKDSLVGMAYKERCQASNVDIFSLDEESPSGVWSKMYTIGPIDLSGKCWELSQCFKNGGEVLILKTTKLCFYDRETKETEDIKSGCPIPGRIFSYTPSLVCVQDMEPMKQELSMFGVSLP